MPMVYISASFLSATPTHAMLALFLLPLVAALVPREMVDHPAPVIVDSSEPANETYIAFPQARDWCKPPRVPAHAVTLNSTAYVLWDWVEGHAPDLRVVLDRPDGDTRLLRGPLALNDKGASHRALLTQSRPTCTARATAAPSPPRRATGTASACTTLPTPPVSLWGMG